MSVSTAITARGVFSGGHECLPRPHVDEAAARRALRAQIERLESEAGALEATLPAPSAGRGARMMGLADLEAARDALLDAIRERQSLAAGMAERQERLRCLREEILRDPAAHPFAVISNADVGDPGCVQLHVRPRFGILGMLMRWWRVRVSSGCP